MPLDKPWKSREDFCSQLCRLRLLWNCSCRDVLMQTWNLLSTASNKQLCSWYTDDCWKMYFIVHKIFKMWFVTDNLLHGSRVLPVVWLAFSPLLHRHESYKTQYRAMFVMNCFVNKEEILKYRKKVKKRNKKRKHSEETTPAQSNQEEEEVYHPVLCTECSTEVAVMDKDEVFHFFNVLASHS